MKVKTVRAWVSDVPDEDAAAGWHTRCVLHPRSQHVRFSETNMEHAMGNMPFRLVATGSTTHEAPRAVIRHCHGCYSPLACRVTHRKCVSVRS